MDGGQDEQVEKNIIEPEEVQLYRSIGGIDQHGGHG